jgi:hydrogenase assembly chaperone HypC/HupF
MCLMAPGRVLAISDSTAEVDLDGRRRRVSSLGLPELAVGDWVIVVGGSAFRRLDPADGREIESLLADGKGGQ